MVSATVDGVPRPDGRLRPLPRPQVRPDRAARLLRPAGGLRRRRARRAAAAGRGLERRAAPRSRGLRDRLAELDRRIDAAEPEALADGRPASRAGRRSTAPQRRAVPPVEARFVRFTIAATNDGIEPCIDELEVYAPDDRAATWRWLRRGEGDGVVGATRTSPSTVAHLNDGRYGNGRSWISNERRPGLGADRAAASGPDRPRRLGPRPRGEVHRPAADPLPHRGVARRPGLADRRRLRGTAGAELPSRPPSAREARSPSATTCAARHRGAGEAGRRSTPARSGRPTPTHLLKRGDSMQTRRGRSPRRPSPAIGPALDLSAPTRRTRAPPVALADWIADPANPLPARVMVNRLWQYHFGQGLVRTPSDFGLNGDRPVAPGAARLAGRRVPGERLATSSPCTG